MTDVAEYLAINGHIKSFTFCASGHDKSIQVEYEVVDYETTLTYYVYKNGILVLTTTNIQLAAEVYDKLT